jgi:hypothetical protein
MKNMSDNGVHLSHSRQVAHVYYQLFDSKMADGDQLWSVPKLEYDPTWDIQQIQNIEK